MMSFLIAFRSAWAHLRKNAFPIVTIGAGICGLFVFLGYIQNTMDNFREFTIQNGLGHLTIARSDGYFEYGDATPFDFILDPPPLESLKSASTFDIVPSLGFSGLVSYGEKTVNAQWRAYQPGQLVFPPQLGSTVPRGPFWLGQLSSGSNLSAGGEPQVVLGRGVMDILGVPLGAKVTLVAILADGAVNAADFRVVGSFRAPGKDKVLGAVRLDDAQALLGVAGPSSLSILLKETASTSDEFARLRKSLEQTRPGWVVRSWSEQAEYFRQVNTMFLSFFVIIATLILVITLFSTVNTLNMSVWSRLRELGTMRVLGTTEGRIVWILFLEGTAVGAIRVAFGYAASVVVSFVLDSLGGLPIVFQSQVLMMKTAARVDSVPALFVVFSLVAGGAALFPGLRAVRRRPAENLRDQ